MLVNRGQDPATRAASCPGPAPEVWPPARLSHIPWQLPMVDGEPGGCGGSQVHLSSRPLQVKARNGRRAQGCRVTNKQVNIKAA